MTTIAIAGSTGAVGQQMLECLKERNIQADLKLLASARSKGKEIIAVGDKHVSYSSDFGKTWKKISEEKGFFVCQWINGNHIVLAGNNRIAVMKLKF